MGSGQIDLLPIFVLTVRSSLSLLSYGVQQKNTTRKKIKHT
nr:MAG TPA: hypothetical protein [Caudoviricetes sp.]DAR28744.1 MAG TPA: hypothetical protein [Herelleviridae sp.]